MPNKNGNPMIAGSKRYNPEQRKEISKVIKQDWNEVKSDNPSQAEFAEKVQKTLVNMGFKSPDNKNPLTLRQVMYQVQRTGIHFKGRKSSGIRRGEVIKSMPVERPRTRIQGIPLSLSGILRDETLTGDQREKMVAAWFEIEKR